MTFCKVIGLSALLGIIWYLAAKGIVERQTVDGGHGIFAAIWYLFFFLPLSALIFCKSKAARIIAWIFCAVGIIFVVGGVAMYVFDPSMEKNGLFGTIYGSPFPVLLYIVLGIPAMLGMDVGLH